MTIRENKIICIIYRTVGGWGGLVLAFALQIAIANDAIGNILPPGTANSGPIPIGSSSSAAPFDQWSFAPFSDSSCGDPGTTAGIDIYPSSSTNSDRLLIYFIGGGYCYDYNTCFNMRTSGPAPGFFELVAHLNSIQGEASAGPPANISVTRNDNAATGNPFADWSKVFVWYCTGDFGTGNHVATYRDPGGQPHTINHVGYTNMHKYLSRLKATFCSAATCTMPAPVQIAVVGTSAGGFATLWNAQQIELAFGLPDYQMQIIDDSGPYMREPYWTQTLQARMALSWWGNSTATLPPACSAFGNCDPRTGGQFNSILKDLHSFFPLMRGSLITTMADSVVSQAFSRLTFGPPDNSPPFATGPCGSFMDGDCLPDGYEGLQVDPRYRLHGYFCNLALPDYTGNEPGGFATFEVTASGTGYDPQTHGLFLHQLDQVRAIGNTLLSDFLADQIRGNGGAWRDHIYTVAQAPAVCSGYSF